MRNKHLVIIIDDLSLHRIALISRKDICSAISEALPIWLQQAESWHPALNACSYRLTANKGVNCSVGRMGLDVAGPAAHLAKIVFKTLLELLDKLSLPLGSSCQVLLCLCCHIIWHASNNCSILLHNQEMIMLSASTSPAYAMQVQQAVGCNCICVLAGPH